MKKKLIFLCLGLFLLCGCEAKIESKITINEDKSMDLEMFMGFDDTMVDFMMSSEDTDISDEEDTTSKKYTDEERKKYIKEYFETGEPDLKEMEKSGFTLKEYQDEKYTGYKVIKKINNIDMLVGVPDFELDLIDEIEEKKIFTKKGSKYKAKILVGELNSGGEEIDLSQYEGMNFITYNFVVSLPDKAISSNATSVSEDGKTLTWDLVSGNIETIEFEFEFPSIFTFIKSNMFLVAGIAVVVVLAIVLVITLLIKKDSKKNQITNTLNQMPVNNLNSNINEHVSSINNINNTTGLLNNINQSAVSGQQDIVQTSSNNLKMGNNFINQQTISSPSMMTQEQQMVMNTNNINQTQQINQDNGIQNNNLNPINQNINYHDASPQLNINSNKNINVQSKEEFTIPQVKPIMPEKLIMPNQQQVNQQVINNPNNTMYNNNNGQGI